METRIDKYLWEVRLYKTRSMAADACKKGSVFVGGTVAKPSRAVRLGDEIQIKRSPVTYSFRVLNIPKSRLGAKLVAEYLQNNTSPAQLQLLEILKHEQRNNRMEGRGRPTKKERRTLEEFINSQPYFIDDGWEFE
jgi:ribosome-associated heat shock protein Hsp15